MDKELPWLADNAQVELKYKRQNTTQPSQLAGRTGACYH